MSQPIWHLKPGSKTKKTFYGIEALETGLIGLGWGHQVFEKISDLSDWHSKECSLEDLKPHFSESWYDRSQLQGFIFGLQVGHTIVMYRGGSPIWVGNISTTNQITIAQRKLLRSPWDHFVHSVTWIPSIGHFSIENAIETLKNCSAAEIDLLNHEVLSYLDGQNIKPITNIQRTLQWEYKGEIPTCSEPTLPISLPLNWKYFDSVKHQSMIVNNSLYDSVYQLCENSTESCGICPIIRKQDFQFRNLFSAEKTKWIVKKTSAFFAETSYCIKLGSRLKSQEQQVLFNQIRQRLQDNGIETLYLLNDTVQSEKSSFTKYAINDAITLNPSVIVICFNYEPTKFIQHTPVVTTSLQNKDDSTPSTVMDDDNLLHTKPAKPIRNPDKLPSSELSQKLVISKNLILEGVPGTGKTFGFKNTIIKSWEQEVGRTVGSKDDAITMHPSTSYEDFLEGLRPKTLTQNIKAQDTEPSNIELRNNRFIVDETDELLYIEDRTEPTLRIATIPKRLLEDFLNHVKKQNWDHNYNQGKARDSFEEQTTWNVWPLTDGATFHGVAKYYLEHNLTVQTPLSSTNNPSIKICVKNTSDNTYWFTQPPKEVQGNFTVADGFFLNVCKEAVQNPSKDFLVLLDEINRCNIPSVFGDLLTAIERSKRATWDNDNQCWNLDKAQTITLAISKRQFFVPENVYVVGTMNTTDRSVAPMDMALRRRFAFHRVGLRD